MFSKLQPAGTVKIKSHSYKGSEHVSLLEFKPLAAEELETGSWHHHQCSDKLAVLGESNLHLPCPTAPPTAGGLAGWLTARGDMSEGA